MPCKIIKKRRGIKGHELSSLVIRGGQTDRYIKRDGAFFAKAVRIDAILIVRILSTLQIG